MLDLAYVEDSKADVDMNVIKTGAGLYIELQGTAEALPFGREALNRLLDLADTGIRQLIALQKGLVGQYLGKQTGQRRSQSKWRLLLATTNRDKMREIRSLLADAPVELIALERRAARRRAGRDRRDLRRKRAPEGALLLGAFGTADRRRRLRARHRRARRRAGCPIGQIPSARCVVSGTIRGDLRAARTTSRAAADGTLRLRADGGRRRSDRRLKRREPSRAVIASASAGGRGFGYDPIFYYPPYDATLAEVDEDDKLAVAHRGQAFRALAEWLQGNAVKFTQQVAFRSEYENL